MRLGELISALDRAGLRLRIDGANLAVLGEASNLTADLRAAIVSLKPQLIEALAAKQAAVGAPVSVIPFPDARYEPFPLTDIQQAYWIGRQDFVPLGGVSTYYYGEFDCPELDLIRLRASLNALIQRHDMLRAVIRNGRQQVLEKTPPYEIRTEDLRDLSAAERALRLGAAREAMSHQVLALDTWPLFDIRVSMLDARTCRLHLGVDLLIADFLSLANLAREWRDRYDDPDKPQVPPELSFRDCVLALNGPEAVERSTRSKAYWSARLDTLPAAPMLPVIAAASPDRRFERLEARLSRDAWLRLKDRTRGLGVSPSSLLLTAFAQVLGAWGGGKAFTLTLTQFGRTLAHPQIGAVIGDFTTSVLAAIELSKGSFAARVQAQNRRLLADLEHADYSGIRVARDLATRTGDASRAAFPIVFTSALALQGRDGGLEGFEVFGQEVFGISQTPQVALDHVVAERDGELNFRWDYRAGLLAPDMVADMFEAYQTFLEALSEPGCDWGEDLRPTLSRSDLAARSAANATAKTFPRPRLERLFAARAEACPTALAVAGDGASVTYGELLGRSQAVALALKAAGVAPGALVGVHLAPGAAQIAAVLGVLFAGCAYVPLSTAWPSNRRAEVLESARAAALVTSTDLGEAGMAKTVFVDVLAPHRGPCLPALENDEELAYVIFTSGSTGKPKGVAITHRAAANTIQDLNDRYEVTASDRVLALSDLAFDLSVYDIFGLLAAGGAVVTLTEAGHGRRNPRHWRDLVETHHVSIWNSVPALMAMMVEHLEANGGALSQLRLAMLSGDWIPVSLPERLRGLAPGAAIYSLGGATEAAIWSIHHRITGPVTTASIPYGKPLANQRWHVLDGELAPCPRHVPGELYIAGDGLAREYWRDPALTAASFVRHPRTGERLYRTGDFGRYVADGTIEFLGRKDGQVKIGGFRIELEEIEAKLKDHPAVRAACAVVLGGTELGLAVVARDPEERPEAGVLRSWLLERLPRYMTPHAVAWLEDLPKTDNGKIDRASVGRTLSARRAVAEEAPAPAGSADMEARILALLAADMGTCPNATGNFFEQGIDSVALVKLHGQLEELLHRTIDPVLMFDFPSPRLLGARLAAEGLDHAAGSVADEQDLRALRAARGARRQRLAASEQ